MTIGQAGSSQAGLLHSRQICNGLYRDRAGARPKFVTGPPSLQPTPRLRLSKKATEGKAGKKCAPAFAALCGAGIPLFSQKSGNTTSPYRRAVMFKRAGALSGQIRLNIKLIPVLTGFA